MNQKIIIADDFYDLALMHHKSFFEKKLMITNETTQNISSLLGRPVRIEHAFNQVLGENDKNLITANTEYDYIAVIYLTLPHNSVSKKGISFYKNKKTNLDKFPSQYDCELNGWQTIEDIVASFDIKKNDDWIEYSSVYVKYNRCVLFSANLWHSYGNGFGSELNNSMMYQKMLIKNA